MSSAKSDNVAVITFEDESKAFQALSVLKKLAAARTIELKGAAILSHKADGTLAFEDGDARGLGGSVATGGLVGAVVGILGGPLGVLLGWGTGALVGGVIDAKDASSSLRVLNRVGEVIPQGKNGLIAEVRETSFDALDRAVADLGGSIVRTSTEAITDEVEAARDAQAHATKAESKEQREEERQEIIQNIKNRFEDLKAKLPGGSDN
ncbi:MAG: DUF1269 domain-containing protein [Thermomicrobiales bacterium]